MITRVNHYAKIELDKVINFVYELKEICLIRNIKLLSFPIIDPGGGRMRLLNFYMLLAWVFADMDIMIPLHDRYFISIGEDSPHKAPKMEGPTDAKENNMNKSIVNTKSSEMSFRVQDGRGAQETVFCKASNSCDPVKDQPTQRSTPPTLLTLGKT